MLSKQNLKNDRQRKSCKSYTPLDFVKIFPEFYVLSFLLFLTIMFLRIHVVKTGEEEGIVIRYLICRPSLQDPTSSDAVLMGKENTDKANVRGQRWVRELNMENWG